MASSRSASPDEKSLPGGLEGPHALTSQHATMIDQSQADTAAQLVAGKNLDVDPAEAARVRRSIDKRLMPLMCYLYFIQYADKVTLGSSAVLGILKSAHLDQEQFNWLSTIFYISYLAFQYPQNLALQRFPVGKWMSINIFIWSIALMSQAACTSFGGLFACRFIMGMCEGAITPGFMLVTSMFYTKQEQTSRVGIWFLMNGVAIIVIGLVSFGVLHTKTERFMPWQWLMIIFGLLTFLTSIAYWFLFPDSPVTATFLSPEDRVIAVSRLRSGQSGVENKTFKKYQAYEALKDPKTWLWAAFAGFANIMNSLSNQRSLIVKQFGFTPLQTTLLGCVDGVVEIVSILVGVGLASVPSIGRAYSSLIIYAIAILGAILVNTLPSSDRIGLLFSYWISIPAIVPFATGLAWISLSTAGHTKRICVNAAVMIGYAVGNASAPFMWKAKYQPRNHIPWLVIALGSAISAALLILIRYILAAENKRRDTIVDSVHPSDAYIVNVDEKGNQVEVKVDRSFLDLTDGENQGFRYPL